MLTGGVLDELVAMRSTTKTRSFWLCCAALACVQCKKQPEPQRSEPALTPVPALSVALPVTSVLPPTAAAAVTWVDPPKWTRLPASNPMRKATYKIPRASGDAEDGELAVFYFGPSEGGGVEANIDRWTKQFSNVKPDALRRGEREANGLKQHTIEIDHGTFASGMPGQAAQAKDGFGLLGGIVQAPSGAYFFKLTGPAATVKASKAAFYELLDSVKTS